MTEIQPCLERWGHMGYSLEQIFAIQHLLLRNLEVYGEDRPDIVAYLQRTTEEGMKLVRNE